MNARFSLAATVFALTLVVASQAKTRCLAQETGWQIVEVLEIDDLAVRLRVRQQATLADADWLQWEFDNRSETPVEVAHVSYVLNRVCKDPKTGQELVSGGMGQGQSLDLFPEQTRGPVRISPGVHRSSEHVSHYAAALLGPPPDSGYQVHVQIRMTVQLRDGRRAQKQLVDATTFDTDFLWLPPDENGIGVIQLRLKQMLKTPTNRSATGYLLGTYLKMPEVAASIPVEELIAALPARADLAFSGRDAILTHLNEHFHDDPAVIAYVAGELRKEDPEFVRSLLMRLPEVWDEAFIEPLIKIHKKHAYVRWAVLRHLTNNGCPQAGNPELGRRLSEVFYQDGAIKTLRQQQTDVRQLTQLLAMTRDRRVIAELIPLLRDRRKLHVDAQILAVAQPNRVCDAAMEAIFTILDGKVEYPKRWFSTDPEAMTEQREAFIAKLETRLSQTPEFAELLAKPNRAGLDAGMLAVAERWRTEQDPRDFLNLKPLVKPGMADEVAREILGLPLNVEHVANGQRWLYLRPAFRQSMGDSYILTLNSDGKVAGWDVHPWNDAYDPSQAPPLGKRTTTTRRDLGAWDDVFVMDGLNEVIARRGAAMFAVPVDGGEPKQFGEYEQMGAAKVIKGLMAGDSIWLFCNAKNRFPFAMELITGKVVEFAIEGVKLTSERSPTIQSHIFTGTHTAVLMVSGGDPATWPRPGNRPVYFWADLRSGASRRLPIGWDLVYCSPDQTVAVFGSPEGRKAIDTRTGEAATVYDKTAGDSVPFRWTNIDPAQPLTDPQGLMIGFAVQGMPYRFGATYADTYLASAKLWDNRIAFHIRGRGERGENNNLWFARLRNGVQPRHVSHSVAAYELLSDRYCVFAADCFGTFAPDRHFDDSGQTEAFVFDAETEKIWNVLDGVSGLTEGAGGVRLYPGFGDADGQRMILCEIQGAIGGLGRLNRERWQRWMMLSSSGTRNLMEMPDEINRHQFTQLWPHHSGVVVYTENTRLRTVDTRVRRPQ